MKFLKKIISYINIWPFGDYSESIPKKGVDQYFKRTYDYIDLVCEKQKQELNKEETRYNK